jgi:hypothetical protein
MAARSGYDCELRHGCGSNDLSGLRWPCTPGAVDVDEVVAARSTW